MDHSNRIRWAVLVTLNVLFLCVLGFYRPTSAQDNPHQPFANAVQQRNEIISQLKELNAELKAQSALMQSGRLTVIVSDQKN